MADRTDRERFDCMLAAQCLNRALSLVNADEALRARRDIGVVWAGGRGARALLLADRILIESGDPRPAGAQFKSTPSNIVEAQTIDRRRVRLSDR